VGYARVSFTTRKDDLERQKQLIHSYAKDKGYARFKYWVTWVLASTRKGRVFSGS
jgi:predicted site-specific integrase-resolvase